MALKLCVNLSEEEAGEMLKNLLLSSKLTGKLQESLSSATAGSQEVFRRRKMGLTTQEMREKIVEKRDIVLQLFRAILGASDSQNLEDVPN
jgi:hypothetical protein